VYVHAHYLADECLCFGARRVDRVLTRLYDEALRPLGLHATQLTLLSAVALLERQDAPMGRLAEALAMDATTLSRNLRPLREAGLVRLERSVSDRRVQLVRLSGTGREMLERALPAWTSAQERVLAALGPALAAELREAFDAAVVAASGAPSASIHAPPTSSAPTRPTHDRRRDRP
jgi:DNA-binding MarR family transcriptional regulator